jgi:hypothetical protein
MKTLGSLNPKWLGVLRPDSGEGLTFDCPECGPKHRLVVYFRNPVDGKPPASWVEALWAQQCGAEKGSVHDQFSNLIVQPSILYPCFHGWVEGGYVFDISESPLTVPTEKGLVALSPLQALEFSSEVQKRASAMLVGGQA